MFDKDLYNTPFEVCSGEVDKEAKRLGAIEKRVSFYPKPYENQKIHAHYFDSNRQEVLTYSYALQICTKQNNRVWADEYYLKTKKEDF